MKYWPKSPSKCRFRLFRTLFRQISPHRSVLSPIFYVNPPIFGKLYLFGVKFKHKIDKKSKKCWPIRTPKLNQTSRILGLTSWNCPHFFFLSFFYNLFTLSCLTHAVWRMTWSSQWKKKENETAKAPVRVNLRSSGKNCPNASSEAKKSQTYFSPDQHLLSGMDHDQTVESGKTGNSFCLVLCKGEPGCLCGCGT